MNIRDRNDKERDENRNWKLGGDERRNWKLEIGKNSAKA